MNRLRLALIGSMVLALAACSGPRAQLTYNLAFDVSGAEDQRQLALAALRVIDRRLESMGEEAIDKEILTEGGFAIRLTVSEAIADVLTEQLQRPLQFRIMESAPEAEADVVVASHGGFKETGIGDAALFAVTPLVDDEGKGGITLQFTEEGRALLAKVFQANKGKYLGMFIRGQLASKMLVETDTLLDQIVIRDMPTAELAEVFADDLNVGRHVTFTPAS
jgi:hypothetical protein